MQGMSVRKLTDVLSLNPLCPWNPGYRVIALLEAEVPKCHFSRHIARRDIRGIFDGQDMLFSGQVYPCPVIGTQFRS